MQRLLQIFFKSLKVMKERDVRNEGWILAVNQMGFLGAEKKPGLIPGPGFAAVINTSQNIRKISSKAL